MDFSLSTLSSWISQTAYAFERHRFNNASVDTLGTALAVVEAISDEIKEGLQEEPLAILLPEGYHFEAEMGVLTDDVMLVLMSHVRGLQMRC